MKKILCLKCNTAFHIDETSLAKETVSIRCPECSEKILLNAELLIHSEPIKQSVVLTTCPECRKQISELSKECVYCGFPINLSEKQNKYENSILKPSLAKPSRAKKAKRILNFLIGLISLVTVLGIYWYSNKRSSPIQQVYENSIADSIRRADSLSVVAAQKNKITDSLEKALYQIEMATDSFSLTKNNQLIDIDGNVYNTISIQSQLWMAENLNVSRFQNGDPTSHQAENGTNLEGYYQFDDNRIRKYYDWYVAKDPRNICPKGWHVPTLKDWERLFGSYFNNIAEKMLEPVKRDSLAVDDYTTSGFSTELLGYYNTLKQGIVYTDNITVDHDQYNRSIAKPLSIAYFWTSTASKPNNKNDIFAKAIYIREGYGKRSTGGYLVDPEYVVSSQSKTDGLCIRCICDKPIDYSAIKSEAIRNLSNQYDFPVVKIGNQIWMAKNLDVTNYRDGSYIRKFDNLDYIPRKEKNSGEQWIAWIQTTEGAYCDPLNSETLSRKYGRFYNYRAVIDPRCLCPEGFRIASQNDWMELSENVNNRLDLLDKNAGWQIGLLEPTNRSGFSAVPSGYYSASNVLEWLANGLNPNTQQGFKDIGDAAHFWAYSAYVKIRIDPKGYIEQPISIERDNRKYYGYSVRCIKDIKVK